MANPGISFEIGAYPHLIESIQNKECVLFLGAGVSIDSGAPSAKQLAEEINAQFLHEGSNEGYPLGYTARLVGTCARSKHLKGGC